MAPVTFCGPIRDTRKEASKLLTTPPHQLPWWGLFFSMTPPLSCHPFLFFVQSFQLSVQGPA